MSFLLVLGGDTQAVVTQEPSLSVSPGGTVTLTCGSSAGSVSTSNYPNWFQQTPGKAPRTLIYYTNRRPSGVPERFSGSISGNKAVLTITGAQPEDDADYYCAPWHRNHPHSDTCRGDETQTPGSATALPLPVCAKLNRRPRKCVWEVRGVDLWT